MGGFAGAGCATGGLLLPMAGCTLLTGAGVAVGKVTVGYQGWFACIGDGAPINGWWHWSQDWSRTPSPANNAIKAWPDVRDYAKTYPTAYANLGNGQTASLFSSYDQNNGEYENRRQFLQGYYLGDNWRISRRLIRTAAYEAAFRPKAVAVPTALMIRPATAGPVILARLKTALFRAAK